jgi:hypothetical protein
VVFLWAIGNYGVDGDRLDSDAFSRCEKRILRWIISLTASALAHPGFTVVFAFGDSGGSHLILLAVKGRGLF